jgi:hypothetical protein
VRKGGAKVGAVDGSVTVGFGRVNVFTARAVEFDGFDVGCVTKADGQEGLLVAVYARATSKVCAAVFLELIEGVLRSRTEIARK